MLLEGRGEAVELAPVGVHVHALELLRWAPPELVERELFGQEAVSESNGATVGERIEREMHQLEQSLMPLLDRAHRMLVRSLDRLDARRSGGHQTAATHGRHSITRSARRSNDCGTFNPMARAVLRLMASSKRAA